MAKKNIICNFYRPPTPHPRYTINEQLDCFFENFSLLLNDLSSYGCNVYIFSDSNIDLLNVQHGSRAAALLEIALEHGFYQTNKKITRFGAHGPSLIDHVFTNAVGAGVKSGSIIVDISDHLPTFLQIEGTRQKISSKPAAQRNFNATNMSNFRDGLSNLSWINVTTCDNVDTAYENFWGDFKTLFELYFPFKKVKVNKNYHKINKFMTQGLLVSRQRKIELLKANIKNRTPESKMQYCNYRNVYNKLLRASKKLFYRQHINANKKKSQKAVGFTERSVHWN
jgi:hypothetical protein